MPDDFALVFAALKPVLSAYGKKLVVKTDTPEEYTLVTKAASPYPQHKGHPMFFGSVRIGKAYVGFHLMPLYMNEAVTAKVSPALKKRMQGKSCLNFKSVPTAELLVDLKVVTAAGYADWKGKGWS